VDTPNAGMRARGESRNDPADREGPLRGDVFVRCERPDRASTTAASANRRKCSLDCERSRDFEVTQPGWTAAKQTRVAGCESVSGPNGSTRRRALGRTEHALLKVNVPAKFHFHAESGDLEGHFGGIGFGSSNGVGRDGLGYRVFNLTLGVDADRF
jgi:hypothetical protein